MYWQEIEPAVIDGNKQLFRCICGKEKMVYIQNVKRGLSSSCGCGGKPFVPKEVRRTFSLMKFRCSETCNNKDKYHYYERGIRVLYKDYYEFYQDVGDKPSKKHTIDRIDVNKNYERGNCKWATHKEQMNNTTKSKKYEYNGQIKTISQWAEEYGFTPSTIGRRLKSMTIDEALNKKVDEKKSNAGKISQLKRKSM